jgi:hypothetical protein
LRQRPAARRFIFGPSISFKRWREGTLPIHSIRNAEIQMPRYATIITADDGAEIVSAIGEFESASLPQTSGHVEQVAPRVRIGMVRGGTVDAVAGFGFAPQGLGPSAARAAIATLKATAEPAAEPAKPARAKPRRKPARKVRKTKAAKAVSSNPVTHG